MEIITKHSIGDTVYYLERKKISKQCSTCEGTGRIDVTKGTLGILNVLIAMERKRLLIFFIMKS